MLRFRRLLLVGVGGMFLFCRVCEADTVRWKRVSPYDDLNVPETAVSSMATEDLVNLMMAGESADGARRFGCRPYTWLYPEKIEVGFETLRKNSNVFRELLRRKDAAEVILKKYTQLDARAVPGKRTVDESDKEVLVRQGLYAGRFDDLETLLCQKEVLEQLRGREPIAVRVILEKIEDRRAYTRELMRSNGSALYSNQSVAVLALCRLLNQAGFSQMKGWLERKENTGCLTSILFTKEQEEEVIRMAERMVKVERRQP